MTKTTMTGISGEKLILQQVKAFLAISRPPPPPENPRSRARVTVLAILRVSRSTVPLFDRRDEIR